MAVERVEEIDSIIIRPLAKVVGITKTVTTKDNGVEVAQNSYNMYYSQEDDISGEPAQFQEIANYYWSTL